MFNLADYETVETRLEKFWAKFPNGRTETKLIKYDGGQYIVWSAIYRDIADSVPFATGLAEETVQGRGVNSTSALENAETSSLGRSLANGGFAAKGKRASAEEMTKVVTAKKTETIIDETKKKLAETSGEYIPVAKEEDPWTIRPSTMPPTMAEAVQTVKEIIGGQTEKDIPHCQHGEMIWKTGTTKAGKPWGHFKCPYAVTGELTRCPAPNDVIWYEINKEGAWQRQKARM